MVLLRRSGDAEVETLTVEQANALLDEVNQWWVPLNDLLEGIR